MKNLFYWVEIPAKDINRAVKFYSSVLNIDLEIMDFGEEKMACFPDGGGSISYSPEFKPSKDGVLVSLNVDGDLDKTLEKVWDSGGRVVKPKTKIEAEGRGYFALFLDSEDNRLGLYSDK